ncbi:MAG: NADP-specific glutamate dehydrogenase [Gammaproteobacteria bacterium]|jgi:glutamate dehydrogenase (NADP+)
MTAIDDTASRFMQGLRKRNPSEPQFHRVVEAVVSSVLPWYLDHREFRQSQILERLTEPDRIISFRVSWQTDDGQIRSNRAWRVQHCNALGPYKGGLRFRRELTLDVLKSLAFEQTLKNALTDLPMGGAKGGTNFNPKGKSDEEIMRFCQSLMIGLHRYIGEDVDVPAGDIGVGETEIGYLFGQYTRLENRWAGVLTGKGCAFGGSAGRSEATGYGCVYFCKNVAHRLDQELAGSRIAVSGSGTVGLYAAEKAVELGARVVTMSDSSGFIYCREGLGQEHIARLKEIKSDSSGRVSTLADEHRNIEYHKGEKPWAVECNIAMPCATENEIDADDAKLLADNGARIVCEGANMPTTPEAVEYLRAQKVVLAPGKAANAGGVAVSGMELSQNAMRVSWSHEKVDTTLNEIMHDIHERCVIATDGADEPDYIAGANLAGFQQVARAMQAYGAA